MPMDYLPDEPTGLEGSAKNIATAVMENADLLVGLEALRDLGPAGSIAVDTMLELKAISNLRLGWDLYDCIAANGDLDGDLLLLDYLPLEQIAVARRALWGPSEEGED